MSSSSSTKVVVTGGGGFIASHVVEELLKRGHHVRATTRDPASPKIAHLRSFPHAAERLEVVKLDLNDPLESFEKAFEGCTDLIHIAAPTSMGNPNPQTEIINPILKGTTKALTAATKVGIKKVVLTSTFAAVSDRPSPGKIFTEKDWNVTSTAEDLPCFFAKTAAEKAAWKFVEELPEDKKFKLVTLLPQMVLGPNHSKEQGISDGIGPYQKMLNNQYPVILPLDFLFVDVRDLALAHVNALESPSATGRYIVTHPHESCNSWEAYQILHKNFPKYPVRPRHLNSGFGGMLSKGITYLVPKELGNYLRANLGGKYEADSSRTTKELGVTFRGLEESLIDTANALVDLGFAPDLRKWLK